MRIEKDVCKMGTTLLTIDHQRHRVTIQGVFGVVQLRFSRDFAPFHNRLRNMDSLKHTIKQMSKQWISPCISKTKKTKYLSVNNVTVTVFSDAGW